MSLYHQTIGDGPHQLVFLHGLYGQGKNWTTIANGLQDVATSHLVDLPNHGRSLWTVEFTLDNQTDEVAQWLRETFDEPVSIVSHSLGGKIGMRLALRHPELVKRLMVVDIAPAETDRALSLAPLIAALRTLDLESLSSRRQANEELTDDIEDPVVRGFLLQNLRRKGDSWHWMANLDLLGDNLHVISGWAPVDGSWDGPVYWVAGGDSEYISPEHDAPMRKYFPRATAITLKNAGHWVHADVPEAFMAVVRNFLTTT